MGMDANDDSGSDCGNKNLISYPSMDKPWLKYYSSGFMDESIGT